MLWRPSRRPNLRRLIAEPGSSLSPDDVLVRAGALFIIATLMLRKGDLIVVVRPNCATNIETPRAMTDFRLDLAAVEAAIRPETKYLSITYPHNPTGVMLSEAELRAVVNLAERKGIRLLFDETYREMTRGPVLPVGASLSDRVISVSSLSKTCGILGIRIGWLITRDAGLMETFLAAREQIGISGSMLDEYIGYVALSQRSEWLAFDNSRIASAFAIVNDWIEGEPLVEWVEPSGGCVCFTSAATASCAPARPHRHGPRRQTARTDCRRHPASPRQRRRSRWPEPVSAPDCRDRPCPTAPGPETGRGSGQRDGRSWRTPFQGMLRPCPAFPAASPSARKGMRLPLQGDGALVRNMQDAVRSGRSQKDASA
ncbi:hypothetical protein MASR2M74_08110 [Paracoccaceae bacterium]